MDKRIVIVEGPSGVGKDTIIKKIISSNPEKYEKITSYTTRAIRDGEVNGKVYNFISEQEFKDKIQSGDIFEYTMRHGTYRGMSKALINKIINNDKIALKDCDDIGIKALQKAYPDQVTVIFITADKNVIHERLIQRGGTEDDIQARLVDYDNIHNKVEGLWDYKICNNGTIDEAVKKIQNILEIMNGGNNG